MCKHGNGRIGDDTLHYTSPSISMLMNVTFYPCNLLSKIIFFKTGSYITNFTTEIVTNDLVSSWFPCAPEIQERAPGLDRRLGGPRSGSG
jgi:hypothetical protein